jgi:hypothetical protein
VRVSGHRSVRRGGLGAARRAAGAFALRAAAVVAGALAGGARSGVGDPALVSFGSYGRVGVASDLRGRTGRPANIVAFGPRLDLPYAELQFNYDARFGRRAGAR